MEHTLLLLAIIIVLLFIAFKVFKSIIKGVLIIIIVAIGFLIYQNISTGTISLDSLTSKFQTQVQQDIQKTAEQELDSLVNKLKGMDAEQVDSYLKNIQSELKKYGLTEDKVKEALNKAMGK